MASPNRCRYDRARPTVTVDPHNGNPTEIRCPTCRRRVIGNSEEKAVAEWNHFHPPSRWPWYLAAAILLAAFIGGVLNG